MGTIRGLSGSVFWGESESGHQSEFEQLDHKISAIDQITVKPLIRPDVSQFAMDKSEQKLKWMLFRALIQISIASSGFTSIAQAHIK